MGVEAGRLVLRWALGLLCLFAGFSALVASGTLFSLDLWVLALARATRTEAVFYASLAYAHAGALEVVGPALFGLCVFLAVSGRRVLAGRLFVAVAATGILDLALKIYLPQALPPTGVGRGAAEAPILGIAYSYSYPSGHALRGALFLGTLFLLAGAWRSSTFLRAALVLCFVGLCASRVYLEVHWASDVLGGALLGSAALAWVFGVHSKQGPEQRQGEPRRGARRGVFES